VCPACGIVAPLSRTSCSVCSAPFGPQPLVAPGRVGSMQLACIHAADFTCRACGICSPVATVELEGEAECMGCGLRQAFDVAQWTDGLGFAHGVADLSGPNLDHVSARSRHAKIGTELTSSTKTQSTMIMDGQGTRMHSLRTAVSPGHPLCKACKAPLEIAVDPGGARTRCPRCNDTAAYALPANAGSVYPQLRAVLAAEQRTDKPVARMGRSQAGVESVVCPQCGGPLSAGGGAELAKCTYCGLAVRVPGKLARQQRTGAPPKVDPFWVLFDGPSPGRRKLERGKSEDDDADDDDDLDSEPPAPPVPPMYGQMHGAALAWAHPNLQQAPAPSSPVLKIVVGLGVALLLLTILAGVAAFVLLQPDDEPPAPAPATTRPASTSRKR
jgi:hypothetical protein